MEKMNGTEVLRRSSARSMKCVGWFLVVAACSLLRATAGTEIESKSDSKAMCPGTCSSDKEWTLELASGVGFSNVRHGQPNQAYTLIPIDLIASLKVDDVSLDNFLGGFLRGYTEFFFRGGYEQIVHGPENHFEDLIVGPRYNFVQPGWKIVPFVEGGVGIGFADSNPHWGGLGQDFNFTFTVAAGAKYQFDCDWFLRAGVEYQHVSNAGLSEPQFSNHPIDSLGPKVSVGYAF